MAEPTAKPWVEPYAGSVFAAIVLLGAAGVSLLERRAAELRSCVAIEATVVAVAEPPAVSSATPSRQLRLVRPVTDRQAS